VAHADARGTAAGDFVVGGFKDAGSYIVTVTLNHAGPRTEARAVVNVAQK
jgi:hypothetical protein